MSQPMSIMNGAGGIPYTGMLSFARIAHAMMPDTSRPLPVPAIAISETKEDLYTPYTPECDGYLSVVGLSGQTEGVISLSKSRSVASPEVLRIMHCASSYRRSLFLPLCAGVTYHIRTYNIASISAQFFPLMAYAMDGRWGACA